MFVDFGKLLFVELAIGTITKETLDDGRKNMGDWKRNRSLQIYLMPLTDFYNRRTKRCN